MKKLISETIEFPCWDDDGCTYVSYIRYTYPVDSFVFIAKHAIRKKKEVFDRLYDSQVGNYI